MFVSYSVRARQRKDYKLFMESATIQLLAR